MTPGRQPRVLTPVRCLIAAALAMAVVAVLDGLDAMIFFGLRGMTPQQVFQYIASSVLGPDAFSQGALSVTAGVALHLAVAFALAVVYCLAAWRIPALLHHPLVAGVVFGLLTWAFMNFVAIPLSRAEPMPATDATLLNGLLAHIFLVGLPIALITRRCADRVSSLTPQAPPGASALSR